jgi:hypothetical protein
VARQRPCLPGRPRQIVGAIFHSSDDERHRRLNDVVCVSVGEGGLGRMRGADLVADVAELVWEPVAESSSKASTGLCPADAISYAVLTRVAVRGVLATDDERAAAITACSSSPRPEREHTR